MNRLQRTLLALAAGLFLALAGACGSIERAMAPYAYNPNNPYDLPPHVKQPYQRWEKVRQDYCRENTFELL